MARYVFDQFAIFKGREKADPDKIGEELERISNKNGGRLQPPAVVTEARRPKSPLHPYFEWSDKVAAEAYRIDQARTLIRSVRIVSADDEPPQHAFLSITDKHGTAFHAHAEIVRNSALQQALMLQAERDLASWERRYRELVDICELVRVARERIAEKIKTARPPAKSESRPAT